MYAKTPVNRYNKTLKMLNEVCPSPSVIFDLGVKNPFSEIMEKHAKHLKMWTCNPPRWPAAESEIGIN